MSTSVSETKSPTPARPAPGNRQGNRLKGWAALTAAIVLSLVLFVVIRVQGHVTGTEFSPTHFQTRDFSFFEIPLIHLQITPIRRTANTPATATYVRQNGLIPAVKAAPTTWHLVSITRGLTGATPADASFLVDQLNLEVGGGQYWEQWSIDHPKQTKVLWPVIQRLADRELYVLMPELFELAQQDRRGVSGAAEQLHGEVDDNLRRAYYDLTIDMREAGRPDLARQLRAEALEDYPTDERLLSLGAELPSGAGETSGNSW